MRFRRSDAIDSWAAAPVTPRAHAADGDRCPSVDLLSLAPETFLHDGRVIAGIRLGPRLRAGTWDAALFVLAPGEAALPYRHTWCREEWALVLDDEITLRDGSGEHTLSTNDMVCLPEGPDGAHQLLGAGDGESRVVVFSSPADRPATAFYTEEQTVVVRIGDDEGFRFRAADDIEDYWTGEPGA